jgi:hypothetical protein
LALLWRSLPLLWRSLALRSGLPLRSRLALLWCSLALRSGLPLRSRLALLWGRTLLRSRLALRGRLPLLLRLVLLLLLTCLALLLLLTCLALLLLLTRLALLLLLTCLALLLRLVLLLRDCTIGFLQRRWGPHIAICRKRLGYGKTRWPAMVGTRKLCSIAAGGTLILYLCPHRRSVLLMHRRHFSRPRPHLETP